MEDTFLNDLLVVPFLANWHIILTSCTICFLIQWSSHYISPIFFPIYRQLKDDRQLDWCVRVVSMGHAVVAMCLIPGWLNPDPRLAQFNETSGKWHYNHFGFSEESQFFYSISVGYFLWDTIICIYYRWGFEFLIHGVLCCLVYFGCLFPFQHYWGRFYLGVYEISTIPLHLRGCYKLLTPERDCFLKTVQTSWVISYTICRIFYGSIYTYDWTWEMLALLRNGECPGPYFCYFFMFVNYSMLALMFHWWILIIKGLLGIGRQNDRQNAEHVEKTDLKEKKKDD